MLSEQLVTFRLGSEEYALSIARVKEIVRYAGATKLPDTPAHMEGIINLRNNVIPVINLAKHFGMSQGKAEARQVVIVEIMGMEVGVIVDEVTEVLMLEDSAIEPAPVMTQAGAYLQGIGKLGERLVIILNLDKLLNQQEQDMLQNVG